MIDWSNTYLNISVNNTHRVKIRKTLSKRLNHLEGFFLGENGTAADILVQLSSSNELHHNIEILSSSHHPITYSSGLKGLYQRHNLFVFDERQNGNFGGDQLSFLLLDYSLNYNHSLHQTDSVYSRSSPRTPSNWSCPHTTTLFP